MKKIKKKHVNMSIRIPPHAINYQPDPIEPRTNITPDDIQLEMVFDKTTTYLAIPSSQLKSFMRDSPIESFLGILFKYIYILYIHIYIYIYI